MLIYVKKMYLKTLYPWYEYLCCNSTLCNFFFKQGDVSELKGAVSELEGAGKFLEEVKM